VGDRASRLSPNPSTCASGFVRVVLLEENRKEIPGFGVTEGVELIKDSIDMSAAWPGGAKLGDDVGPTDQIRFLIRDADRFFYFAEPVRI
jgi:hypothetical protein